MFINESIAHTKMMVQMMYEVNQAGLHSDLILT